MRTAYLDNILKLLSLSFKCIAELRKGRYELGIEFCNGSNMHRGWESSSEHISLYKHHLLLHETYESFEL